MLFQKADVFIVEDEVIIAEDLAGSLEEMGHQVVGIADNATDAIAGIKAADPHIVLLDINIEGEKDGIDLGALIQNELRIPIVYISAFIDANTRKRAQQTGPVSFLSKPFDARELEVAIKFALGKGNKFAAQRKNGSQF